MLPDDGIQLPKHVGTVYGIKRNIRFSALCWLFSVGLITHGMKITIKNISLLFTDTCEFIIYHATGAGKVEV
jgi:hypothetical protein